MRLWHLITILAGITTLTQAHAASPGPAEKSVPLAPASRYSGNTPIELNNGLPFNNGTFGAPNKEYESFADGFVVPGLSDKAYPYSAKTDFVSRLEESATFVEHAISNWKNVTPNTKPEAKEYGERSAQTMEPLLKQLRDSIKAAAGSSQSDWEKNQVEAKRALTELRGTYSSLHKNVK
jgi:hypothetical protein